MSGIYYVIFVINTLISLFYTLKYRGEAEDILENVTRDKLLDFYKHNKKKYNNIESTFRIIDINIFIVVVVGILIIFLFLLLSYILMGLLLYFNIISIGSDTILKLGFILVPFFLLFAAYINIKAGFIENVNHYRKCNDYEDL